ncbi:MAG: methyltransferase domain-containing protein [Chloroflexi bacterium]|nr:methyltransferase domain-containing protein [Chloroflexota bacterium]
MKKWLPDILACPVCGNELKTEVFESSDAEIHEGIFSCRCKRWYPIIDGVPRMLWGEHRGDYTDFLLQYKQVTRKYSKAHDLRRTTTTKQVRETFSTIWDKFPDFGIHDERKQAFYDKWMAQKLGLDSTDELYSFISFKRAILEVGIGSGQKLKMMAEHTKGRVIGVDLTSSVEHAFKNIKKIPNVTVIQADLFALPFTKESFDFIISDGVLHHTPDTKRAFLSIIPFLARGGEIAIRIYKKGGPIREFCDDFIRSRTTKMSQTECWEFCTKMAKLGENLAKARCEIEIPDDIELLSFKKGRYDLQRFIYYNMFKCFYNEAFTPEENVSVNFDWYSPVDAHRHTEAEVKRWFTEVGLSDIQILNPESGISARGRKI